MVCARVCALRRLQANHKDGGTGGLLALNYQTVPDLPQNFGMVVTGQKVRRRLAARPPLLMHPLTILTCRSSCIRSSRVK